MNDNDPPDSIVIGGGIGGVLCMKNALDAEAWMDCIDLSRPIRTGTEVTSARCVDRAGWSPPLARRPDRSSRRRLRPSRP